MDILLINVVKVPPHLITRVLHKYNIFPTHEDYLPNKDNLQDYGDNYCIRGTIGKSGIGWQSHKYFFNWGLERFSYIIDLKEYLDTSKFIKFPKELKGKD